MTMFHPEEVIFAPTSRCNLDCSHCTVKRGQEELSVADAVAFLDTCSEAGIERLGFSGGEPFLRPDFLVGVSKAAVERGMYFDRLMTNGDWWTDTAGLSAVLDSVRDAGFDGVLGLSWDSYHGQAADRMLTFLQAVFASWGRKDTVELLSVRSPDDAGFLRDLDSVAAALGGRVESGFGEPSRIVDAVYLARSESDPDNGSGLIIPITRTPRSKPAGEGSWDAKDWFTDDWCEGPGNVFYVHPYGTVAPCCGFANEQPALAIGTVHDSYADLMANAEKNIQIRNCFDEGLGSTRERLEAAGLRFPGKTRDMCFFCDYLCDKSLV
jgi:hypothetical protein